MVKQILSEQEIREKARIKIKQKEIEAEEKERYKKEKKQQEHNKKEIGKIVDEVYAKVDPRFEQEDLLVHISNELDKDHIEDNREKLGTFIVGVSSYLPNPKDHTSSAFKGNSSAGKDNLARSCLKHFPKEDWAKATRITQSEMEDRLGNWKILHISEINKNREGGANLEIVETFKQAIEDGLRIFKKDNITGEPKEIIVEQKTGFYGTTESETNEELETRYVIIPVRGSETKNRKVIQDVLKKDSDIDSLINNMEEKESWIAKSIRGLDKNLDVLIPYAEELTKKFQTEQGEKELFDYSKERVKRDVKRLMSLTKAIAWLFQKRRVIIEKEKKKIIISEPTDFITALKIFTPFLNISYSGLDPRIEDTFEKIKNLEGKHSEEIKKEFGNDIKADWVIRTNLQKEIGVSLNTIKDYINKLKDEGFIQVYWEESHPRYYLIRPVNIPISHLLEPITLQALTGYLQASWEGIDMYKRYGKDRLDNISLINSIDFFTSPTELTRVSLTGVNEWSNEDKKRLKLAKIKTRPLFRILTWRKHNQNKINSPSSTNSTISTTSTNSTIPGGEL